MARIISSHSAEIAEIQAKNAVDHCGQQQELFNVTLNHYVLLKFLVLIHCAYSKILQNFTHLFIETLHDIEGMLMSMMIFFVYIYSFASKTHFPCYLYV